MSYKILVDLEQLKNYKSNYDNEKNQYMYFVCKTFSGGYISNCGDKYVQRMKTNLSYHYNEISESYSKINTWWTNYNNDLECLERQLSNNELGSGGIIENSIVASLNRLPKLYNYSSIYQKYASSVPVGGIDASKIDSSIMTKIARCIKSSDLNNMTMSGKAQLLFDSLVGEGFTSAEHFLNIEFCGPDGENIKVTLADGREFIFENIDDNYYLSFISCDDSSIYLGTEGIGKLFEQNGFLPEEIGNITNLYFIDDKLYVIVDNQDTYGFDTKNNNRVTTYYSGDIHIDYDYDISEAERQHICSIYGLNPATPIDYIARSNIRGYEIDYYGIDSMEKPSQVVPVNFSKWYSQYPNEILSKLNDSFKGIFISPWSDASNPDLSGSAGAYVSYEYGLPFMFVPIGSNLNSEYYKAFTPLHEMGHAIEQILKINGEFDLERWNELFEQYKEIIPQLPGSCYSPGRGYEITPNELEMFADASSNYFQYRDELRRYAPEICAFLDEIYR